MTHISIQCQNIKCQNKTEYDQLSFEKAFGHKLSVKKVLEFHEYFLCKDKCTENHIKIFYVYSSDTKYEIFDNSRPVFCEVCDKPIAEHILQQLQDGEEQKVCKDPICIHEYQQLLDSKVKFNEKETIKELTPHKISVPKTNIDLQSIRPEIKQRFFQAAWELENLALDYFYKKDVKNLILIKNELSYRIAKRLYYKKPVWEPTDNALTFVMNLVIKFREQSSI